MMIINKVWKRIVACGLVPAAALSVGCGEGLEMEPADAAPSMEAQGTHAIEVSPELFDLVTRWSVESLEVKAAQARSGAPEQEDLLSYARAYAPKLAGEAEGIAARMRSPAIEGPRAMASCNCTFLYAFDAQGTTTSGPAGSDWSVTNVGAAHTGRIYQNLGGQLKEQTTSNIKYGTQFRMRMACMTPDNLACLGSCSGKLYAEALYSSRVDAIADTGGIWNKGATAQVVDGVTLDLKTPFATSTRIFEKAAAISHFATTTTFQPEALANVVKSGLNIFVAITSNDPSKIQLDLAGEAVKSLFGLINRSGADGQTTQMLRDRYQSPFESQPITVSYSSSDNLYYALDLTSAVSMKTRGYGGWHKAEGRVSSSLLLAAYVDNLSCSSTLGMLPPRPTGFWRYDSLGNAPDTMPMLQDRARNFFLTAFGKTVSVTANQGSVSF